MSIDNDFGLTCDDRPGEHPLDVLDEILRDEKEELEAKGNALTVLQGERLEALRRRFPPAGVYADKPQFIDKGNFLSVL